MHDAPHWTEEVNKIVDVSKTFFQSNIEIYSSNMAFNPQLLSGRVRFHFDPRIHLIALDWASSNQSWFWAILESLRRDVLYAMWLDSTLIRDAQQTFEHQ